jgi:hypothetical protein
MMRIIPDGYPVMGPSTMNPAGDWRYHDVVLDDGRVYDSFTGEPGLPLGDYMSQFEHADALAMKRVPR